MSSSDRGLNRLAASNAKYLEHLQQPKKPPAAYIIGYNADTGLHQVQAGGKVQECQPITNGALKLGDRVQLRGNLIDGTPRIRSQGVEARQRRNGLILQITEYPDTPYLRIYINGSLVAPGATRKALYLPFNLEIRFDDATLTSSGTVPAIGFQILCDGNSITRFRLQTSQQIEFETAGAPFADQLYFIYQDTYRNGEIVQQPGYEPGNFQDRDLLFFYRFIPGIGSVEAEEISTTNRSLFAYPGRDSTIFFSSGIGSGANVSTTFNGSLFFRFL